MGEAPRPAGWQRRLALVLGALGGVILVGALVGFLGNLLSARAPGATAGGAATVEQRCSRGVPAELAQACIEETRLQAATAARRLGFTAALGVGLCALAVGIGRSAGRRTKNHRRYG